MNSGYTKKQVKRAGKTIVDPSASARERIDAEDVINFWRDIHRFPLQCLLKDLDDAMEPSFDCLIAGRIKKFDTIVDKMRRKDAIVNLAAMDDIAGCRIVVSDLASQAVLCEKLNEIVACDCDWSQRHDYVAVPKRSGYRGKHLLFRYVHPTLQYKLVVELQIRTEFQHAWATAVEMYDEAVGSRLKFGEGGLLQPLSFRKCL